MKAVYVFVAMPRVSVKFERREVGERNYVNRPIYRYTKSHWIDTANVTVVEFSYA